MLSILSVFLEQHDIVVLYLLEIVVAGNGSNLMGLK